MQVAAPSPSTKENVSSASMKLPVLSSSPRGKSVVAASQDIYIKQSLVAGGLVIAAAQHQLQQQSPSCSTCTIAGGIEQQQDQPQQPQHTDESPASVTSPLHELPSPLQLRAPLSIGNLSASAIESLIGKYDWEHFE